MKMIGYVRVSTERQADEGYSLDAQRQDITRYCQLYDIELIDIIADEGISACNLEREGLHRALNMINVGLAEGLVVAKLDRLTRSVRDLSYLLEEYFTKYALMSVADKIDTSSASGRLVLNIIISVAQWEREAISERIKKAMDVKGDRGERRGNIPYGKRLSADGVHLEDDISEKHIINDVKGRRLAGYTFESILQHYDSQGIITRNGKPFTISAIHRIANL